MLQIYNTMTRQKENFKSVIPGVVKMYVCGPTVYNYIHIGNARSSVAFDTMRRYLEYTGYRVDYISNFTDLGDKLTRAAAAEKMSSAAIAAKYISAFNEDTAALNIEPATYQPRATENIQEIIAFIKVLIAHNQAYVSDGDVYFRARKFAKYGSLSHQPLADLEIGASQRIAEEETARKEDPIDFALWKAGKSGEITWESPWGAGSPGWHVECSVMSLKYLGTTIDIHGGGEDLAFPHHENEIAQSESYTGKKFVNYWVHNGFVTVGTDNEKMSKSRHNFVTAREVLNHFDHQAVRFFMASTHYRRPLRYTEASLEDALNEIQQFKIARANLMYRRKESSYGETETVNTALAEFNEQFMLAMDDDFNVQNALAIVHELTHFANKYAENVTVKLDDLVAITHQLDQFLQIFGVDLAQSKGLDGEVADLIVQRDAARAAKDYATSDQIRDQLNAQHIILEDTPQGTRWRQQ